MLYGFNAEHARILKNVARREGLAPRVRAKVKYPKPLPDDFYFRLCKPDSTVAKGATVTVSIYDASDGSDTGENVTGVIARAAGVTTGKYCSLIQVDGVYIVLPCEC